MRQQRANERSGVSRRETMRASPTRGYLEDLEQLQETVMDEKTLDTISANHNTVYIGSDLASLEWKLAVTDRSSRRPIEQTIGAFDLEALVDVIRRARRVLGLEPGPTVFCYEAGRDGFSVFRALECIGVVCLVVDPASIETSRRKRQAKTDRLDAKKLLSKLRSYVTGDRDVFAVVRIPSLSVEDERRRTRERDRLVAERTQHRARIKSLLAQQGLCFQVGPNLVAHLQTCTTPFGEPLGPHLKAEILRELERLELVEHQLAEVVKALEVSIASASTVADKQGARLAGLRAIGTVTGATLPREFFWRDFHNRKEVGGAAGITGTPRATGISTDMEQGISKTGNGRVRRLMMEIAWSWVRHQPTSKITLWYKARLDGTKRSKRKAIVGVARRLLIALWRYATQGVFPEGALLKGAA